MKRFTLPHKNEILSMLYHRKAAIMFVLSMILFSISTVAVTAEHASSVDSNGEQILNKVEVTGDRPVKVNGEPFFPIGMYQGADISHLADAGFNVIHRYTWEGSSDFWRERGGEWLDELHEAGIMGLVSFYRPWVQKLEYDKLRQVIEMHRDHPALLAWHVMDEPAVGRHRHWPRGVGYFGDKFMPAMYDFIKEHDPHHPVTAVFAQFREVEQFIHTVDIFQTTYYPIPPIPEGNFVGTGFRGFENFAVRIRHGVRVSDYAGGVPWWPVLQAYEKGDHGFPTDEELRGMTYTCIALGARGIFFWALHRMKEATEEEDFYQSENWRNMATLVGEINQLKPVLLADTEEHFVSSGSVRALVKSDGEDTYIITANMERAATAVSLDIPEVKNANAIVIFGEGDEAKIENGELNVQFKPIESRVYRIIEFND